MTDPSFPPPPPASPAAAVGGADAFHLDLTAPPEVANWRPLVHWLLVIPFAIVAGFLGFGLYIVSIIAFFTVVFTKRIPPGLFGFMAMVLRVGWRSTSYQLFLREAYPSWEFTSTAGDPGDDPAVLSIPEPGEMSRWLPFVKWLLVIPHFIVLGVLGIGVYFAVVIGFFAVLFTGRWPEGLRNFVIGFERWALRVMAYALFMTDDYPPFSLD
jgi:hypothetical protein